MTSLALLLLVTRTIHSTFGSTMISVRGVSLAARRAAMVGVQRRSVQTVPRIGPESAMVKDAVEQLKARIAYQRELEAAHHHSHQEEVDEMWKWIKISFIIAFPVCVLSSVKDIVFGEDHGHPHEGPEPDYMKIRNKAFPWECEDCELFNLACWKKCKAEMAE